MNKNFIWHGNHVMLGRWLEIRIDRQQGSGNHKDRYYIVLGGHRMQGWYDTIDDAKAIAVDLARIYLDQACNDIPQETLL